MTYQFPSKDRSRIGTQKNRRRRIRENQKRNEEQQKEKRAKYNDLLDGLKRTWWKKEHTETSEGIGGVSDVLNRFEDIWEENAGEALFDSATGMYMRDTETGKHVLFARMVMDAMGIRRLIEYDRKNVKPESMHLFIPGSDDDDNDSTKQILPHASTTSTTMYFPGTTHSSIDWEIVHTWLKGKPLYAGATVMDAQEALMNGLGHVVIMQKEINGRRKKTQILSSSSSSPYK